MTSEFSEIDSTGSNFSSSGDTEDFQDQESEPVRSTLKQAATKMAKGFSTGAESMSSVVKRALLGREHVLMVRVNEESLERIAELKDAGLFRSRSEAAAYLIAEGIISKEALFQRIEEKIHRIQKLKEELKSLAEHEVSGLSQSISDELDHERNEEDES